MKLLLTGDWHLRHKRPEFRSDESYFLTQYNKVKQILEIAFESGCSFILQPGDFFDDVDCPDYVKQMYIRLLRKYKEDDIDILCIAGQHDMRYHSRKLETTPLAVMEAAGCLKIIKEPFEIDNVIIFGCSWKEEISKVEDYYEELSDDDIVILMMHKMVVEQKIWEGQKDFIWAKHLSRQNKKYDLFVTGDNHQSFQVDNVVNCGSLMRSRIDQADHKPVVYIYDTDKRELSDPIYLKIEKPEKVFLLDKVKELKKKNEHLNFLVDSIEKLDKESIGLNFRDNLDLLLKGVKKNLGEYKKGVFEIIEEVV